MAKKKKMKSDRRVITLRFPEPALGVADALVVKVGLGNRSEVIRSAALHGLREFKRKPSLIADAAKIRF